MSTVVRITIAFLQPVCNRVYVKLAQLSQRDRVIEHFAKSLKITQGHSK